MRGENSEVTSQGPTKNIIDHPSHHISTPRQNYPVLIEQLVHNIKSLMTAAEDLILFLRELFRRIPRASPIGPSRPHINILVLLSNSVLLLESLFVAERGGTIVLFAFVDELARNRSDF